MSRSKGENRAAFSLREVDRDYSGLTITDRYLRSDNVEKSFFNGVNLSNCLFDLVKMNSCEFTEARIDACRFDDVDLSGSDFVDCLIDKTTFENCGFEKGEWREATFQNCRFVRCSFSHTTITLCKFIGCDFDAPSMVSAEHRAIYFNVFTLCRFSRGIADATFASRNFGTPAESTVVVVIRPAVTSIENVCLRNNLGQLRVAALADVAEAICAALGVREHRRASTLTFFSKIVRVLTDERRISATSLIYLEGLITGFAAGTSDQDLFMASMAAVIEIRSALFTVSNEPKAFDFSGLPSVRRVSLFFSESYARHQAEVLRECLIEAAGLSMNSLTIEQFQSGSTLIELASTTIVSAGALLTALNFVLRQAKVTVKHISGLKKEIAEPRAIPRVRGKRALVPLSQTRVQSIIKTDSVAPELVPVRSAVRQNGRVLVELDEKATVVIFVETSPRRIRRVRRSTAKAG